MSIDSIGDLLTIIRNGTFVAKPFVMIPFSKKKRAIVDVLKHEGFIRGFTEVVDENSGRKSLKVMLKYSSEGESVIHEIKRASSPGRRVYVSSNGVKPVIGGLGLSILTTDRGVISHKRAKTLGVGGELICTVW